MKVKSESDVAQLCLTLRDPVDCSLPGSSVHGIFQARVLEWGAIAFSERSNRGLKNFFKLKKRKEKRMVIKIVKIYLGLSLVLLWAVWGQFIFR